MERVVVALGGNALLRRGADDTFEEMYRSCREAAERIADIAAEGWEVVVTHGNGPQVGRILLQQEAAASSVHPMPLDVCGAQSQGQIGYLLQVTIGDVFFERGMERPVATVLTLDPGPAGRPRVREIPRSSSAPTTTRTRRGGWSAERGYTMKADPHGGWRRVVPSPTPYSIVETPVDRAARRRRRDRDRERRRRGPGRRGGTAADRQGGGRRQGPRRRDPRARRSARRGC